MTRRPCPHRHQTIDAEKDGTRRQRCLDCGAIVAVFRGPPVPYTDAELLEEAKRRQVRKERGEPLADPPRTPTPRREAHAAALPPHRTNDQ